LAVLFCAAAADAGLIQYMANPDPNVTDVYVSQPGTQVWPFGGTLGYFTPINDGGTFAWAQDTSSNVTINSYYWITVTNNDANQAAAQGWSLTARVRLPVAGQTSVGGSGKTVAYGDGDRGWIVHFSTQANGDPTVWLLAWNSPYTWPGVSYTLSGAGTSAYHTYKLVYDPAMTSADLFVDGNEVISNFVGQGPGYVPGQKFVAWGDTSGADGGDVNWNFVEWYAVPEPATMALIGFGAAALLVQRKRRQASEGP
jgi:hypothetical protein